MPHVRALLPLLQIALSWPAAAAAAAAADRRLNVLLIVSDDLRPEMGCYGGQAITPALDEFAASNGTVLFDRAYVQQAMCVRTFPTADRASSTHRRHRNVSSPLCSSSSASPEPPCCPNNTTHSFAHARTCALVERADACASGCCSCCPTRSSFLTGRRPDTTRVWDLKTQFRETAGAAHWATLPQAFRDAGYATFGMGKVFHPVL